MKGRTRKSTGEDSEGLLSHSGKGRSRKREVTPPSIDEELPPHVLERLDALISEGGASSGRIGGFPASEGYDVRKTAIGRYGEDFMHYYLRLKMVEKKARALASGDDGGLLLEEAASRLFSLMILETLLSEQLDPAAMTKLLSVFSRLQSSNVQRERLRREFKKRTEKTAEDEHQGGLSDEAADEIRRKILGIPV